MFGTSSSSHSNLSLQQSLELANICISNARTTKDFQVAQELCHDANTALSRINKTSPASLASLKSMEDQNLPERITATYSDLGELQVSLGRNDKAQASYKNAEQWRDSLPQKAGQPPQPKGALPSTVNSSAANQPSQPPGSQQKQGDAIVHTPRQIFTQDAQSPSIVVGLPEAGERLDSTLQLAHCIEILQSQHSSNDSLDPTTRNWLQVTVNNTDEYERLVDLATGVIREFKREEIKDVMTIAEVLNLVPVLERDVSRDLLRDFYTRIDQSDLLDVHQLEGLAQLIQGVKSAYLDADDLVKILELLNERLNNTHGQSPGYLSHLTMTTSHVLDAMADTSVNGLDREKLHAPLMSYLEKLKKNSDCHLVYQAAYAYQALQYVPDNETLWGGALRRTGAVVQGVSSMMGAVKGLDLNKLINGLKEIRQGFEGVPGALQHAGKVASLVKSGQGFLDSLKEGFSFERKREWYPALRGADVFIREGQFVKFEKLVYEAPCRGDPAFQWGLCQRLGEIAANDVWDMDTRRSAVTFLGEMYQDDMIWGQQSSVKQWIVKILMRLSLQTGSIAQYVENLLGELETNGDAMKQTLYHACQEEGYGLFQPRFDMSTLAKSILLDRAQDKPDVETSLRQLRKRRMNERGNVVYIPPQAKATLNAPDESRFPLTDRVNEYLKSDQTVLLLLGDSGSGKSTFNRSLELDLWQVYNAKTGIIPLYINLPAIDKPEHDLITKQLRKLDFTEPQIRELKYRQFFLICDGYDESQQTRNLYTSNKLNEEGEWKARMVISCRSEYVGHDYRDRFEPGGRNQTSSQKLFDEAVITPFSVDQVQEYIKQYVALHRPLWETENYAQALDLIPGLMDLVKNPFLLTMSLEVLPRMMDPGQPISNARITKVALYDQFVEQWLERGKKRIGEKNLSFQERSAFDSLCEEGFTMNGIDYLKKLSVAIYKEQGGQPVVEYSRLNDEGTWKADFFSRNEEKQLLREACPLVRNGNQYRFVHRSLLEYGLTRAVFEPQPDKKKDIPASTFSRRGSMNSIWSFEIDGSDMEVAPTVIEQQFEDPDSPLVWRSFAKETSILQFFSDRVRQEPSFKRQLLAYIESSKKSKKWRVAAANAITILVKAGMQFNHEDLRGIQIPGADLSHGMFESAQLQGADLRQVDFSGTWLRRADLSGAQMAVVQFGELPFLMENMPVNSCAYSFDAKLFVAGLCDGVIRVYSTSTWEHVCTLDGHKKRIQSIAYSPIDNQLVSGSIDHAVRLWDVESRSCRYTLNGHSAVVNCVAFAPCGQSVASASSDSTVRVWDVRTGECSLTLTGHKVSVLGVTYSPKGHLIASGGYGVGQYGDLTVRLWDAQTGVCLHILSGHTKAVSGVAFSPRGDWIASASADNTIRIWDAETGACCRVLTDHTSAVATCVFSPQGDIIASTGADGTVRIWDAETGVCRQIIPVHPEWGSISCVVFSPNGDRIACDAHCAVRMWDLGSGKPRQIASGHSDRVRSVKYSPHGNQVASCGKDRSIRLWEVETGFCHRILTDHSDDVMSIAYSPRGDLVVSGSSDGTVRLWDTETGTCRHTFDHTMPVASVAYSPRGDQVASRSASLKIWDVGTRECRYLNYHTGGVDFFVYSPNGNQIAGCTHGKVTLWDTKSGACIHTLSSHDDRIESVVFSPQGGLLASAGANSTVRLWDLETGECRSIFIGHTLSDHIKVVQIVVYSPQGGQVVSGSQDGLLKLWDLGTGERHHTLAGHTKELRSVVFSPLGNLIVSSSDDKTLRLWSATSGQCQVVIQDLKTCIRSIAWSTTPDTNCFITGGDDGSVIIWQVVESDGECHLRWRWRSVNGELNLEDTSIQHVRGLSQVNKQVLKQRGAVGEPLDPDQPMGDTAN